MWIHSVGGAVQGAVGCGAFGLGLTWTPELGARLGAPLSLASLALLKAATSLATFGVIFQKTKIPPCLAALGCAPVPPKPRDAPRPHRALGALIHLKYAYLHNNPLTISPKMPTDAQGELSFRTEGETLTFVAYLRSDEASCACALM